MEKQEYQEQLQAATQIIIEAAQGIDAYKTVTDKVIERVSRRPEAVIPDSECQKIRDMVSAEIISQSLTTVHCAVCSFILRTSEEDLQQDK